MSPQDLPPLDPELAELAARVRTGPPIPAEAQARLLRRLDLGLAVGDAAGELPGPMRAPAKAAGHGLWKRVAAWRRWLPVASVAFVTGGAAGAGIHAAMTRSGRGGEAAQVAVAPSAPRPRPAPAPAPVLAPVAQPAPARAVARERAVAPAHATPASQPQAVRDRALAAELALIQTARTALARGDAAACLDALARHEAQFPEGRLAEERDSLRIEALVKAGRADEARARAVDFHARYPTSLLAPMVDAAIRSLP